MRHVLEAPLSDLERRLFQGTLEEVDALLTEAVEEALAGVSRHFRGGQRVAVEEVERLLSLARRSAEERQRVEHRQRVMSEGLAAARRDDERHELMLEFLALFTDPTRLHGDRKAFQRHMALDCVAERFHRWRTARQLREEMLVRAIGTRLSAIIRTVVQDGEGSHNRRKRQVRHLLNELEVESFLLEQARPELRWRNRCGALRALGQIAREVPAELRVRSLQRSTAFVVRCALDQRQPAWVQREALEQLPALVERTEAESVLRRRLFQMDQSAPDDMFVRVQALRVLPQVLRAEGRLVEVLRKVLDSRDASEMVRMEVPDLMIACETVEADRCLLQAALGEDHVRDPSARVRASCLEAARKRAERFENREEIVSRALARAMVYDPEPLVRRVAMEEAVELALFRRIRLRKFKIDDVDRAILIALDHVIHVDENVGMKRLAQEAREVIVVRNQQAHAWFEGRLRPLLDAVDEWATVPVKRTDMAVPDDVLGRLLAHYAREGFGVMVEPRPRRYLLHRGDRFRLRLWRVLHEMRNPDTAKRQAHRHTTGRIMRGELRAPPGLVAELVETKVPGERVWHGKEHGWRRFLPLVDDFLSMFSWLPWRRQYRVRIFSSQGVTEIRDDRTWWKAMWAHLRICWRYAPLARLRNASPDNASERDRSAYLRTMRDDFGFQTLLFPAAYRYEGMVYAIADATLDDHFRDAARAEAGPEGDSPPFCAGATGALGFDYTATASRPAVNDATAADMDETGEAAAADERQTPSAGAPLPVFEVEDLLAPLVERSFRQEAAPLAGEEDDPAYGNVDYSSLNEETSLSLGIGDLEDTACDLVAVAQGGDPAETQAAFPSQGDPDDTLGPPPGDQTGEADATAEHAPAAADDTLEARVPGGGLETTGTQRRRPDETTGGLEPVRGGGADDTTADEARGLTAGGDLAETADGPGADDTLAGRSLSDTGLAPGGLEDTANAASLSQTGNAMSALEDTANASAMSDTGVAPRLEDTADAPRLEDTADAPALDETAEGAA